MDSWKSWWSVLNVPNDGIPSSFQCLESNLPLQFTGEFGEYPLPCLVGSSRSTDPIYPLNSIIHVHACTYTCTCECMYYEWEREKYDIVLQMGLLKINIIIILNIIIKLLNRADTLILNNLLPPPILTVFRSSQMCITHVCTSACTCMDICTIILHVFIIIYLPGTRGRRWQHALPRIHG